MECINVKQMHGCDLPHAWDESESMHFTHGRRHIFAWRGLYEYHTKFDENMHI